jgi:hypothetical protein
MFLVYDQGLTPSALVFGRAEMVLAEGPTSLSALGSLATPGRRQGRHRGSGPSASGQRVRPGGLTPVGWRGRVEP